MKRRLDTKLRALALAGCASIGCSIPVAFAQAGTLTGTGDLADISRRLRAGDRGAIDDLLARTNTPTTELAELSARIERLRGEVDVLRARRGARPSFPLTAGSPNSNAADAMPVDESTRVDGVREARAWLRAGEPERALRAIPNEEEEALYVEAQALEQLGRRDEALATFRRVAENAKSPTLRMRAVGDVEHLEWRARFVATHGGRP